LHASKTASSPTRGRALQAAQEFFQAHGIRTMNLGDSVTGEASEVAESVRGACAQVAHAW